MLVAISECHSPCRPRHSICLLPLLNPITYVHQGISSYPSAKSSLFLPLLPLPVAPSPLPFPISPSPLPPLPISLSPFPLPVSPSPLPSLLPPPSFLSSPSPSPLLAFASSSASLYLPPPLLPVIPLRSPLLAFASSLASLYLPPPSILSSPSPPRYWPLPVRQHPCTNCPSPTDIYDH